MNRGSSPPGNAPKLLHVLNVDKPAPQLHGSFVLEPTECLGYRHPFGTDNAPQAFVGVVGRQLVSLVGHNAPASTSPNRRLVKRAGTSFRAMSAALLSDARKLLMSDSINCIPTSGQLFMRCFMPSLRRTTRVVCSMACA